MMEFMAGNDDCDRKDDHELSNYLGYERAKQALPELSPKEYQQAIKHLAEQYGV